MVGAGGASGYTPLRGRPLHCARLQLGTTTLRISNHRPLGLSVVLIRVAYGFLLRQALDNKHPILGAFQPVGKRLLIKRALIPGLGLRHGGKG